MERGMAAVIETNSQILIKVIGINRLKIRLEIKEGQLLSAKVTCRFKVTIKVDVIHTQLKDVLKDILFKTSFLSKVYIK